MRAVVLSSAYIDPSTRGKLRALAALGCAVSVGVPDRWTPRGARRQLRAAFGDDAGVRVVPIPVRRSGGSAAWSRSAIRRLVSDVRADVVQVEEEPWTVVAAAATAAALQHEIPSVLHVSESVRHDLPLLDRWRRARTLGRVTGVIAANRLAAGLVARPQGDLPTIVLPRFGVKPPASVTRTQHQGLSLGFVGRLVPERGLDLLLRACLRLRTHWTLTVVGSGPAQEELEALAAKLGIAARVAWLGAIPSADLEQVWPHLDCVVLPARATPQWVEVSAHRLLQAMAHGIAVVGSDSGAIPDVVGRAGLIVPRDDVDALAAALQRLADDPREREALGTEGRRRVMAEFVDDALARRTLEFWRQLRARVRPPGSGPNP